MGQGAETIERTPSARDKYRRASTGRSPSDPDNMLANLLQNYDEAQTRLTKLQNDLGTNHPDVQRTKKLVIELNTQIDNRVAGILEGMRTHVASLKSVTDNASGMLEKIQETEASKLNIPKAWWPYFKASADLDRLKQFRNELYLRLAQEKANAKPPLPDANPGPK